TYVAGRATLCASPDDLVRYDQVWEAYFNARDGLPRPRPAEEGVPTFAGMPLTEGDGQGDGQTDDPVVRAMASDTEVLRHRDVAGETVPDWSGGTRLGETLKIFLDRWGQRGLARGAVVVVFSDGWERGDPALLAEQMARLHRIAHRVVWANPHRGKHGYEPVQQGVVAALPYVDDFVSGHSLATY